MLVQVQPIPLGIRQDDSPGQEGKNGAGVVIAQTEYFVQQISNGPSTSNWLWYLKSFFINTKQFQEQLLTI